MKKILISLAALAFILTARAQMTPEAVMGMTPDLPSAAALLNHWKEHNDPNRKEAPDSDILNEFRETWTVANRQVQEMQKKTLAPSLERSAMAGKVAGTNMTVKQASGMSEAQAQAMAGSMVKGRLGELGLSQADLAKLQSGNLSEAEQEALASKVMAGKTGGLTMKDMQAMSNMNDEQRKEYMQQSGLGASMTAKMNADKGKTVSSQKQYQLVAEMTRLSQEEFALQNKANGMITGAQKEGRSLFDRKYRKADEELRAEIGQAAVALEDAKGEAAYKAALARMNAAQSQWFANMSKFYGEYIPMYRNAVVGAMDCCRAQILPLQRQRKDIQEKLYALTGSAEYALSENIPFQAAYLYFEFSERIIDFELEL